MTRRTGKIFKREPTYTEPEKKWNEKVNSKILKGGKNAQ